MTAYDQLRAEALDALAKHLAKNKVPAADSTRLLDGLRDSSFAGFIALLGTSKDQGGDVGQTLLHEAAGKIAASSDVKQLHLGADDIEGILTAVFTHGAAPQTVLEDPKVRDVVLRGAVDELAKRAGVPVTPEQAKEAVRLIATGDFLGDAASALAAAAFAVRNLPIGLVKDTVHLPHRVARLLLSITRDVAGTPFMAPVVLQDLLDDGKLNHPPGVLRHTMASLLGFATVATTTHTISDLIAPNNRSVRLALVIYARANGIPLADSDLDVLRDNVFNTDRPDLGPVLVTAVDRYLSTQNQGQLLNALQQLAAFNGA